MWEEILKAITMVYLPSTLKFIFGPMAGYAAGLHLLTTIVCTAAGMMTSVVAFTYFGNWLRTGIFKRFLHHEPKPLNQRSRFVRYFMKYEMGGIAFLTPIILTPIGGTILAVSIGVPKEKIIVYMFVSAVVFATIFSLAIYLFGDNVLPEFVRP